MRRGPGGGAGPRRSSSRCPPLRASAPKPGPPPVAAAAATAAAGGLCVSVARPAGSSAETPPPPAAALPPLPPRARARLPSAVPRGPRPPRGRAPGHALPRRPPGPAESTRAPSFCTSLSPSNLRPAQSALRESGPEPSSLGSASFVSVPHSPDLRGRPCPSRGASPSVLDPHRSPASARPSSPGRALVQLRGQQVEAGEEGGWGRAPGRQPSPGRGRQSRWAPWRRGKSAASILSPREGGRPPGREGSK